MKEIKMFVIKALIACALLFLTIFAGILIYIKVPYKTIKLEKGMRVYISKMSQYEATYLTGDITLKYYNNGMVEIIEDGQSFYARINNVVVREN